MVRSSTAPGYNFSLPCVFKPSRGDNPKPGQPAANTGRQNGNHVAAYHPHHDRDDHFGRVLFQPSRDRIVLPSGLPHKTQSAVILRLRQDEAALRRAHRWGFAYAVRRRPSPVPLCPRRAGSVTPVGRPGFRPSPLSHRSVDVNGDSRTSNPRP